MISNIKVAIALFAFSISGASANSIINGDFETGTLAGWTTFNTANGTAGTGGLPTVVPFDTVNGVTSQAVRFTVGEYYYDGTQQGGGIFQSFLTGSGAISISADVAAYGATTNGSGGVFSLIFDSVVVDTFDSGAISAGQTERDLLSFSGVVGAGSHELRILITRSFRPLAGIYQYVDNVNVSAPLGTVPEPASLALLGVGIAGLGFSRYKKAAS